MTKVIDPDTLDRFQVCIDPIAETVSLRGLGAARHAIDSTGDSDGTSTFTDAGADFITTDSVAVGDVLVIISDPADDGGIIGHYRVTARTATTITADRNIPASTAADLDYAIHAPQTAGAAVAQVADGVNMQVLFSFMKEEWLVLAAGLGNAEDLIQYDFPMVAISSAAGQYILGGVNGDAASAWSFANDNGVVVTSNTEGVPRELVRDGGWQEKNASDVVLREYANFSTLGSLDTDAQATIQQGDATGTPADFKLLGPVNQAFLTFGPDVGPDAVATGFVFAATVISRNDGGNWATDNYRIGDYITIRSAEDVANDGSYGPITAVDNTVDGDITIATGSFTVNADDATVIFSVDHRKYSALRVRKKGRSYALALHVDGGVPTTGILPLVNKFPLAHASDPAIVDDDGTISGGDGTANGDVYQQIESHTAASDGVTTDLLDGTLTFSSAGGGFQTLARTINVLQPGDSVEITSGSYQGVFEIKSIESDLSLTLYHELYDSAAADGVKTYPGNETTLSFTARTGVRDVGAANATLADFDGDTGTLTSAGSTFDVDTAIGDRIVAIGDYVEVYSGTGTVLGYYKVISQDSATVLTLNTSDQIFAGETNQSYRIWRPGMFMQRFEILVASTAVTSQTNMAFADSNPDTLTSTGGTSWATAGYTANMVITISNAEDAGNIGSFTIGDTTPTATVVTLIASDALTVNATDTTALNSVFSGDKGIVRAINSVNYTFHWRLFSNGASLAQCFQFIQRELRRATDIDGGSGTERGDVTDLLMNFISPNGTTLDLFPDDLSTAELNNVTYQDIAIGSRNNAFLVGITFDINANLINSATSRLTAYFTSVPTGDFGSNTAVIVDDNSGVDMNFTALTVDISTTFDYTNNSQGGRTPDTNAAITVVAIGDDLAQHILATATITKVNSVTVSVQPTLERNYENT